MERVEPDYPFPFKIKPLKKESVLDEQVAYGTLAIGVVGIIIPFFSILSKLDPWANKYWDSNELDFYLHSVIILIIITALIANKQWGYYYRTEDNEGKKGIFKGKVKQVNPRERDLDIILALMGSLLFAFAGLPVYWFFALFLYSIAVVARCYFTLKRKKYAQILNNRGIRVRQWYTKALDERWHNLVVKNVLGGWIVSHVFIGMYSLIVFILFNTYFDN